MLCTANKKNVNEVNAAWNSFCSFRMSLHESQNAVECWMLYNKITKKAVESREAEKDEKRSIMNRTQPLKNLIFCRLLREARPMVYKLRSQFCLNAMMMQIIPKAKIFPHFCLFYRLFSHIRLSSQHKFYTVYCRHKTCSSSLQYFSLLTFFLQQEEEEWE